MCLLFSYPQCSGSENSHRVHALVPLPQVRHHCYAVATSDVPRPAIVQPFLPTSWQCGRPDRHIKWTPDLRQKFKMLLRTALKKTLQPELIEAGTVPKNAETAQSTKKLSLFWNFLAFHRQIALQLVVPRCDGISYCS